VAGQAPSPQQARLQRPPLARRAVGVLRELFPEAAEPAPRRVPRSLPVVLVAAAVPLGVLVMLARVAGPDARHASHDSFESQDDTPMICCSSSDQYA
jgi:hypothetical protein